MAKTAAVILAAGKGTRMGSEKPKVLHRVAGKYLVQHVFDEVQKAGIDQTILVIGHGGEQVKEALGEDLTYAWQKEQLGTGHAVMQAMDLLEQSVEQVLVLSGDVPLMTAKTIKKLLEQFSLEQAQVAVLTAHYENPSGYGRIIRDQAGRVEKIVEHRDASSEELEVQEINSGTYCFSKEELKQALKELKPDNSQGEYYLTDVIQRIREDGLAVTAYLIENYLETMGVNNRIDLSEVEGIFKKRINEKLMLSGVTIIDPETTYIDANVEIGQDTTIYPFTILQGKTSIGKDCSIGPNVTMVDSSLGNEVKLRQAVLEETQAGNECNIGPFSYLRPGTVLGDNVRIGDFVEIKKSEIGTGSKVPHLTYVGDAIIGKAVNIGAGTIVCNYDGNNKHQTIIEDDAFIGSNSNLVAPIRIGPQAYVAAGSTLTADVPKGSLAVARGRQRVVSDWENKKNK